MMELALGSRCLRSLMLLLDAFTVATFVPAHADFPHFPQTQTAFDVSKTLIEMGYANDLRIRIRGSGVRILFAAPSFTGISA